MPLSVSLSLYLYVCFLGKMSISIGSISMLTTALARHFSHIVSLLSCNYANMFYMCFSCIYSGLLCACVSRKFLFPSLFYHHEHYFMCILLNTPNKRTTRLHIDSFNLIYVWHLLVQNKITGRHTDIRPAIDMRIYIYIYIRLKWYFLFYFCLFSFTREIILSFHVIYLVTFNNLIVPLLISISVFYTFWVMFYNIMFSRHAVWIQLTLTQPINKKLNVIESFFCSRSASVLSVCDVVFHFTFGLFILFYWIGLDYYI